MACWTVARTFGVSKAWLMGLGQYPTLGNTDQLTRQDKAAGKVK